MIASAIDADMAAVVGLWRSCELTRPWNDPQADFHRALAGPGSTILLVRVDDRIIGSVMVGHDGHRGWLYYLAVAPDRRRQHVARRLVAAAEDWLRAANVPKVQLMVRSDNADALAFYAALGLVRQDVVVLGRFLEPSSDHAVRA